MGKENSASVLWLPAHPSYGSVSMARYWNALEGERRSGGVLEKVSIKCPLLPCSTGDAMRSSKLTRLLRGHFGYGYQCSRSFSGEVCHVLDHSFAHLRRWLPESAVTVITVHDLFPLSVPDYVTPAQQKRFRWNVGHLAQYDHIISVSEYTKQSLIDLLGISPAKISVVPNGVSGEFARGRARTAEPGNVFPVLSVGNEGTRKNLKLLAPLFRELSPELRDRIVLWRVGQKMASETLSELEGVLRPENIVEHGRASDGRLRELYATASVFIFPSLYEGFGLPTLEAMSQGCPVLSSNRTSLPEAGGSAALYFDPDEVAEGARQLARLIEDVGLWDTLSKKGYERAQQFTWAKHAEKCRDIYRSLTA